MYLRHSFCILLVEDNEADVRLIEEGLSESTLSYTLRVAQDGESAMKFLRRQGEYASMPLPDIILLDLNLPMRSGIEVLQEIKMDPELKRIPVLVLTSSKSAADVSACYTGGANSFMKKPGGLSEVYDLINTIQHYWLDLGVLP
jgi:CheY-like chemotaxis protein